MPSEFGNTRDNQSPADNDILTKRFPRISRFQTSHQLNTNFKADHVLLNRFVDLQFGVSSLCEPIALLLALDRSRRWRIFANLDSN